MNIVIFASDSKGKNVLKNIVLTLKKYYSEKINFIFIFSNETQLQYPLVGLENFRIDCDNNTLEVINTPTEYSESLNMSLPWKPDVLLIQRERWQPEQSLIEEFKNTWGCKIGVVEVNSQVVNHIESQFEMGSRFKYPQHLVDFYFEGSDWTYTNRKLLLDPDWDKSIVTGNPRFDIDFKYSIDEVNSIKQKYRLDDRKLIIFWSVINTSRNESLECLQNMMKKIDKSKYRVLFKPYPGEPFNDKFKKQFDKNKILFNRSVIDNLTIIYDESDIFTLTELSDIHITALSSTFLYPLTHRKNIVNLQPRLNFLTYMNQVERYINETDIGVEDSAKFWMSIFNLDSIEIFCKLVETFDTKTWEERNNIILNDVINKTYNYDDDLNFLIDIENETKPLDLQFELMEYFDSYNDGNSSHRIIKHLIREHYK